MILVVHLCSFRSAWVVVHSRCFGLRLRPGIRSGHNKSFEELGQARDDGLQLGDSLFDGRKVIEVKMAQECGAGEIGDVAGSSGAAGVFEDAIFIPAKAEDHHAVSRVGKHWIRRCGTCQRTGPGRRRSLQR
jgi:hypothetical protein